MFSIISYGARVIGTIDERELCPPLLLGVLGIEKGSFHIVLDYGWLSFL